MKGARQHSARIIGHILALGGMLVIARFLLLPCLERFEIVPGESGLCPLRLPAGSDGLQCWIDTVDTGGRTAIEVHGWAFLSGEDSSGGETYVVLQSEDRSYVFDSRSRPRPDITERFGESRRDLDGSGFLALLPARDIKKGDYRLGIYVRKNGQPIEDGGKEAFSFTGWTVRKTENSLEAVNNPLPEGGRGEYAGDEPDRK